jgi:broad specificity phosphatase PhoE
MQTLWLARHANREDFANPNWHATADRPYDPGLSPDGVDQAQKLGRRALHLDIDRIVTSPFLRAVETANHVAEALDERMFLEPGLGEWLNDDWFEAAPNTRSPSTLVDRFPRVDPSHAACREPTFPESKHRALARLGATATCLAGRYTGETLLLVGHGITVQGILHGLVGRNVPDPGCPLASLTKVVGDGDTWTLKRRNDTSHLENGARSPDRLV